MKYITLTFSEKNARFHLISFQGKKAKITFHSQKGTPEKAMTPKLPCGASNLLVWKLITYSAFDGHYSHVEHPIY
jgi:hypothetical protein